MKDETKEKLLLGSAVDFLSFPFFAATMILSNIATGIPGTTKVEWFCENSSNICKDASTP